jgi:hypothetical protein
MFTLPFLMCPVLGAEQEPSAQKQQMDSATVAEIQNLFQKWAQLRTGMSLEVVENIVGPLTQRHTVEAMRSADLAMLESSLRSASELNHRTLSTQEIGQYYKINGVAISFKLVFDSNGALVKHWLVGIEQDHH